MSASRDVIQLAGTIARLWNNYDRSVGRTGDFEQVLWKTGGLIRTVTDRDPTADPDQLLYDLVMLLRQRRVRGGLDFPFLAETVLLHRAYPNGPPPLSWQHFKFLVRIDDDAL